MAEDLGKSALEFIKLSPRWLAPLALATGALIFAPMQILQALGLNAFVETYRGWIGLAFLVVASLLLVGVISWVGTSLIALLGGPLLRRSRRSNIRKRLAHLSEEEKQILRYYVAKQTRTNWLKQQNGAVIALREARIIRLASATGSIIEGFAMMLTDDAVEILYEDTSVLDGTTRTYYTDKRY